MGGGALVDAINLHYLVRENKSVHPMRSSSSSTTKSWLGADLRNLNGSLHHFDFTNLDPTVADININLGSHDWYDIYFEIGQRLEYLFSRWELNIFFSDNMYTDALDEKFLILNHDCAFSNSKEVPKTGEHWKVTDQRWQVPTKQDIPENNYYCYNLQLVNLYNHTSLTFACNVCNFVRGENYYSYDFQNNTGYLEGHGYILPNHLVPLLRPHNLNNNSIPFIFLRKTLRFFAWFYKISFNCHFIYESKHSWKKDFDTYDSCMLSYLYSDFSPITSAKDVHFSSDDRLWEDGQSGYFDHSKVHSLIQEWRWTYSRGDWDACLEYAVFANIYLTKRGNCFWIVAGGAWKNVDCFPHWFTSENIWKLHFSLNNIRVAHGCDSDIFSLKRKRINNFCGLTDYIGFLQLDRKPDYILTSENELYYFYRSSVSFYFFNTYLIDQVIMKKVNEGVSQNLDLSRYYTLTKKAGCYQFLVTFLHGYYSSDYYGYKGTKTITFNIRIIPDYDFSQGLNAVTLNYISNGDHNYAYPADVDNAYWVVDIYLDKKIIRKFCDWLRHSFLVTESMLSFFNKPIFKNMCSFDELHLKDSINHFQDNSLYQFLDDQMTHNHDDDYLDALKKSIKFYWKNTGHLHFVLKKDYKTKDWNIFNSGKANIDHFYDKIVQPDQWK